MQTKRLIVSLVILASICFLSTSIQYVYAQEISESSKSLSLEELVAEALANNRELQGVREELQAAKYRVPQSWALDNPSFGYSIMGPDVMTRRGPQEEVYEAEQMIPFPGKLIEKRKMALAEVDAAKAKLQSVEKDIILKVSQTYYDLYAAQAALSSIEEILEALKRFESIAQARYASTGGTDNGQRDVVKAQAEVSETLERLFMLRQQRDTLTALLNSILSRKSSIVDAAGIAQPKLSELNLSLEELLIRARENRPELLEAAAMLKKDEHANALAKYEYAPDFSVGFQYVRIGSGETSDSEDGQDAWMIPLKVTLPLWQNRVVPAVLEAKRNFNSSEAKYQEIENLTTYEIKSAYYKFIAARQVVDLYKNALIPQAQLVFRSDQAGYEAGKTDVLNLIDSERVYINAKVTYYQALSTALKGFAEIERVVGEYIR